MLPTMFVGKGVVALSAFKKHWGKIIAGLFVVAWIWITLGLYDETKDLTMALGSADSAVSVCIAERTNMDNVLLLLKADIAMIQADNNKYKEKLEQANINIGELEESIQEEMDSIDQEVFEESCEGAMDWMLKKALDQ